MPGPHAKVLAVDFDGTVVTHEYPRVGRDVGAVPWLRHFASHGVRLILWTMRSGPELAAAVRWYEDHGLPLYGVNANPDQASWTESPKAYAHAYVDDAAIGAPLVYPASPERPFVDWEAAGAYVCIAFDIPEPAA
jgi:hypothetical protein